jgi:hypothetical protein
VTFSIIHPLPVRLLLSLLSVDHRTLTIPGQRFTWHRKCFVTEVNVMLSMCLPGTRTVIGGIAPHVFNRDTRWRWVVSFKPQPLYFRGMSPRYPLNRRPFKPQSRSGRFGEVKNFAMPEIQAEFHDLPLHNLLTPWPLFPPGKEPTVPIK